MGACDDGTPVAVGDGHGEFRSQETVRRGTHVLEVTLVHVNRRWT
jgi:hypothetical protein